MGQASLGPKTVFLAILKFPSGAANAAQWVSKHKDQLQISNIGVVVVASCSLNAEEVKSRGHLEQTDQLD